MKSGRVVEEAKAMDNKLKEFMQELRNAINESLSDSERIAEAIDEVKKAGYDVSLILEATIGFNKREDGEQDDEKTNSQTAEEVRPRMFESAGKIKLTSQDQKFLRALKIAVDDEGR